MSSSEQTPQKRSRVYSTAVPTIQPYRIPEEMMPNNKNMKTNLIKSKYLDESKANKIQNYFFKTKLDSSHETDHGVEFRKCPKAKIGNKLHLDLPTQKKVRFHKYIGQQKHFQQTVSSFFGKIFKSCMTPEVEENFQECNYCEHRYYNDDQQYREKQRREFSKQLSQPYISYRRLTQRQKQPVQVFYQQITNEPIKNNRWENTHLEFSKN